MTNQYFESLVGNESSKHQAFMQNYFVIQDTNLYVDDEEKEGSKNKFFAFQEPLVNIPEPKASLWEFLSKDELQEILKSRSSKEIRKYLDSVKMDRYYPKGKARNVFLDLMHSVTKFCKTQDYSIEKSGALMSQFYLTHILVTTAFDKSAEKVFTYFKEMAFCHTLPDFPPKNAKIFSQEETKRNMQYFCRIYLRNLPLIRFVCLPNFALHFKYPVISLIHEEQAEKTAKGKKNGKKEKK